MPLHDNRKFSLPRNGGKHQTFSRQLPLTGKLNTQYGSGQSMGVAQSGVDPSDPETWVKDWPKAGQVLGVPKCVILSSFPSWMAWWPASYFHGPQDIIGQMFTPPNLFGNYYYFDQWNYPDSQPGESPFTTKANRSASPWMSQDGYIFDDMGGSGNQELYTDEYQALLNGAPVTQPPYGINECWQPPSPRFSQLILERLENPYYQAHEQYRAAFRQAKAILESDPTDPIYVIDAAWCPTKLSQIRNAYLTKTKWTFNEAHGHGANIADTIPCWLTDPICWGPSYPDLNASSNYLPFSGANIPWLACGQPGFGTNVLHLYVGHANMSYGAANSIFDYQAWPSGPEGFWIGPIFNGSYLGAGLPFFKGRRSVWRDAGLNFGYTASTGATGLYDAVYGPLVQAAANQYKQNALKYRNFATKLYTYGDAWSFDWQTSNIWRDQSSQCEATQFYFGFDFADFANSIGTEDHWAEDLSGYFGGLKVAATFTKDPSSDGIRTAISTFYPPIQRRVEAYYNSLKQGTLDFYQLAIDRNGLSDYGVSVGGSDDPLRSVDGIVEIVRAHFRDNP